MKRKFLIYGLIVALFFTCFSFSVNAEEWYDETVNYAIKHNLVNGYPDGSFMPYNNVSKGELIKLVVARYMDPVDLSVYEHWAIPYVKFAEQNGIVPVGMYNTSNLDQPATRKEICYMLIQACRNIAYKPVLEDTGMVLDFEDLNEQNKESINENGLDYAQAMRLCYAMGIIKGYPTQVSEVTTLPNGETRLDVYNFPKLVKPNENVTRAETATMVIRTFFEQFREYTLVERKGTELPSNASEFVVAYTYMPKSFYEDGKDTFFDYIGSTRMTPAKFYSNYSLDDGKGKVRVEGAFNTLYNVSYKMTDEEWNIWKEDVMQIDGVSNAVTKQKFNLNTYIQFIKDNRIVLKGGYILDPSTVGDVRSKEALMGDSLLLAKGIGRLYVENPNNIENVSLFGFQYSNMKHKVKESFDQGYILYQPGGTSFIGASSYWDDMFLNHFFIFVR